MNLTVKQLKKACNQYDYLLVSFPSGYMMGINCKVANIAAKKRDYNDNDQTNFIGYIPCNFQEYINYKHPFL